MKLIIECTEQTYSECKKISGLSETAFVIANGKPYDDSGDLISREALKEQINATDFDFGDYYDNTDEIRKRVCEAIDKAPPVETFTLEDMQNNYDAGVDSVIGKYDKAKGEWSQYSFHDLGAFGDWDYKCSKCNKVNGWKANFCPNCGAEMRKGGAE